MSSLVWMGGEEEPRPVGDQVARVATPPQGQYGLSLSLGTFSERVYFTKKERRGQDMCCHEQVTIDRARRYWKTVADTNSNVFNLTPLN